MNKVELLAELEKWKDVCFQLEYLVRDHIERTPLNGAYEKECKNALVEFDEIMEKERAMEVGE